MSTKHREPFAMLDTQVHSVRVALVGNPNCGKTALFNALTGSRQKVANYPGVTVERKEGTFATPQGRSVVVVDLPGTYSLRGRSPDEAVTRDAILGRLATEKRPDILVCVADATNLRLMFRLVLELKASGLPMMLVLNMHDIAEHRGVTIDRDGLARALGIPVVPAIAIARAGARHVVATIDHLCSVRPPSEPPNWQEPDARDVRAAHTEADRLVARFVTTPAEQDPWTRRLDAVLLHPVLGIPILLAVLFLIFQAVFSWATAPMDLIKTGFVWLGELIKANLPDGMLASLLVDGVVAGVGSVVVFLPQILILFFFILLLEDFGYMARAAFLMDRIIGAVGLHGRSFIPLLSSFACAIPGIMATRVIDNRRQRLATIMITPLMTCSARIPIYTLLVAAFIPDRTVLGLFNLQGLVMFALYGAGVISALMVAWVFRRFVWKGQSEPFIMELPDYKLPSPRNVVRGLLERGVIFLQRAGTTILSMMILIWFLSSVPTPPAGATDPAINYSFAGMIGHALQPLLAPIGFNWQIAVALIPGMAAREVAVGALATIYAVGSGDGAREALGAAIAAQWSLATALALLVWYVFAPQCASTLGVLKRETNSWKWPAVVFLYMLTLAYLAAFIVYQAALALGA
jgi:ferrous iron transport protein B